VANHGNFRGLLKNTGQGCEQVAAANVPDEGGRFQPPSITFYRATAKGDEKPLRTIQGTRTQLDWPMGIDVEAAHDEVEVANTGDNSVLIFRRTATGDVAPLRTLRGPRTGINRPMGVSIDTKNNEIWVSNFGDHTALVLRVKRVVTRRLSELFAVLPLARHLPDSVIRWRLPMI